MYPVRSLARAKGASPKDLGEATSHGMYSDVSINNRPVNDTTRDALYLFVALFIAFMTTGILSAKITQDNYDNEGYSANTYQSIRVPDDHRFMKADKDIDEADVAMDAQLKELKDSFSAQ